MRFEYTVHRQKDSEIVFFQILKQPFFHGHPRDLFVNETWTIRSAGEIAVNCGTFEATNLIYLRGNNKRSDTKLLCAHMPNILYESFINSLTIFQHMIEAGNYDYCIVPTDPRDTRVRNDEGIIGRGWAEIPIQPIIIRR